MFSSFPKYKLPDNLTSTNCMFLLTFLDFCPHLQQTARLFFNFLVFCPRLQQTTGLFSQFSSFLPSSLTDHRAFFHFSCFLPSSPTDHRAFFSLFLIFTLIINRPQGFFLNFPNFYPHLQLTTGLFSQFS